MKNITVGVEEYPEELVAFLSKAGETLEQLGLSLDGEQFTRGKYTFYTYRLPETTDDKQDLMNEITIRAVADSVADYVTQVWERQELKRIVTSDFYYYASDEVDFLADSAVQMLSEVKGPNGLPLRHAHLALQVAEHLKTGQELLIEGFLRFRMQSLTEDLQRVVEQAIDEYLLDLEYQEFVKLLRYFLEAQEPGLPLLHLVCLDESTTRLFDAEGQPVDINEWSMVTPQGIQELGFQVEDLMSVLIALAPSRVQIHLVEGEEQAPPVLETVKKIFMEKATMCGGCPLCEKAVHWKSYSQMKEQNRP